MNTLMSVLVIFAEPGFPAVDVATPFAIDAAFVCESVEQLENALQPDRVLVWRHGAACPSDAWPALRRFLENGGSMLYLGGEPFTRPVIGPPGRRVVQPRSLAMLKALRLNQCSHLDVGGARLRAVNAQSAADANRTLSPDAWCAILQPRLTNASTAQLTSGAQGPPDALIRPLWHVLCADGDERFPCAAAAYAIDHCRGAWAGGRWTFWLASDPPDPAQRDQLIRAAASQPVDFRAIPTFACYRPGETPAVKLRLHRPRAAARSRLQVRLDWTAPNGETGRIDHVELTGGRHATQQITLPAMSTPGLYHVRVSGGDLPIAETGFWIFDRDLFTSGKPIDMGRTWFRRAGRPMPIVGTTVMSRSVHRDFLFEPNPLEWDATFEELAALNINCVRTGVWYDWNRIAQPSGQVDEAWLRALEAYYLTARRHDIPVVFTFFAFLPEAFGGENPYLDPRAVNAQRAFLATVATRFADARHIIWDLINEPSFSSPDHLWKCRPNGDDHEQRAFRNWLEQRFQPLAGAPGTWEDVVRARWRIAPDVEIDLPQFEDFAGAHVFEHRRPYRAMDYIHFAQDAFADWAAQMTAALREAGSHAAITVGQDEGGLLQRPHPLMHHHMLDFTSMHTWWFNDHLLWDAIAARAADKPLLVSETGVMLRERLDGAAHRDADANARLLSRKLANAFAAGATGVVQWCYHVNPYMPSDNEVAIGLVRPDGSYKPEHAVLRRYAAFFHRNAKHLADLPPADVVVVIPSHLAWTGRDLATPATQRAIETLTTRLGLNVRAVPEYRVEQDLGLPKMIVLPACGGLSEPAWQRITSVGRHGALIVASGSIESDDAGLPASRLGLNAAPLHSVELVASQKTKTNVAPASTQGSAGVSPAYSVDGTGVSPAPTQGSAGVSPAPTQGSAGVSPAYSVDGTGVSPAYSVDGTSVSPAPTQGSAGVSPAYSVDGTGVSPAYSIGGTGVSPAYSVDGTGVSPVRFGRHIVQSMRRIPGDIDARTLEIDGARFFIHPLPIELAESDDQVARFYSAATKLADLPITDDNDRPPPVFVREIPMGATTLAVMVNDSGSAIDVPWGPEPRAQIPPGEAAIALLQANEDRLIDACLPAPAPSQTR